MTAIQEWRGQRLGLPRDGAGAVAGFGRRAVAIFIDWMPCWAVAFWLTENPAWSAIALFALVRAVSTAAFGRSPGQAVAGVRVAMLDGRRPSFTAAVVRTVLICLALIPPAIYNADGRGLHDRAAGTVVLRVR